MFGWGIVGTGYVARKFAWGLRAVPGARVAAVCSRSESTARAFSADFGDVPFTTLVEDLVRAPGVDAVYIAPPPTCHRDQALAALAAGVPVLIEKPLAASPSDARLIADAARSAGVFALEGVWTRFLPAMATARSLLLEGAIGDRKS